jgi:hypothetical protein
MATYTSTLFAINQPKAVHAGNQSVSGQIAWTAASSIGDVAFLCKIPHGATIVDVIEDHTTGATATALKFGLATGHPNAGGGASYSCFIAAGAQATVNRRSVLGLPVQVSVSDLDPNRYGIFTAKMASGTATTSLIVNFTVIYRMDN